MTAEHDRFADWDGAYVMGALTWAERQQYEEHFATCPICTEALAELSPLPGLLSRLSPDDADLLLAPIPAELPHDLAARSIEASRVVPLRRRRTRMRLALVAAAAAVVAAAVVVPITLHHAHASGATIALTQVVPSPLSATVRLTATDWGTEVDMDCFYAASEYEEQRPYSLYVIDRSGGATLVSSWHAGPGDEAKTSGSTNLPLRKIAEVQVRAEDGTVLLASPV